MQITPGRIRTLGLLAAASPFIALVGVRVLDPFGGPAVADASTAIAEPDIATQSIRRAPKPTEAERDAIAGAAAQAGEPAPTTPFYYAPGTLRDEVIDETPTQIETPALPTPSFQVSAILSGAGSPIAVINGAALRVGQELDDGWALAEVHEAAREVVIEHTDGRRLRVPIRR